MTNQEKLVQAEKLLREIEDSIMPPSLVRSDLHSVRKQIMDLYVRLP